MPNTTGKPGPGGVVERLCQAVNAHDLEELENCFALDYVNETPAHPTRGFRGRAQVRKNWEQIFGGVPDLSAEVRWIADEDTAWSEWNMRGTRRDGSPHHMCGVVVFGVADGLVTRARFYLEPVEEGGGGVDDAVRRAVGRTAGAEVPSAPPPGGQR